MSLLKTQCLFFILLTAVTIASDTWIAQYEQSGSGLLTNHWQYKTSEHSRIDLTHTGFNFLSNDATAITGIYQDVPVAASDMVLLLSADMKSNDVLAGEKPWNQARLLLLQIDRKKEHRGWPSVVVSLAGTHNWENYQGIFTVSHETQSIRVIAQLNQATGSFQVSNIQLYPVHETRLFTITRNITLSAWSIFFLVLVGSCFCSSTQSFFLRLLLICAFISIIVGTTLPGDIKNQVSDEVKTQLHAQSGQIQSTNAWDLSKIWHFCSFFLFGVILCVMVTQERLSWMICVILFLAAGTELAQLYIEGRTALIMDFFIDAAGGIIGLILIWLIKIAKGNRLLGSDTARDGK